MPVTVRNTDILFNDGTTQSTAAGALTTTAVLNATAGASVGAVGTYALVAVFSLGSFSTGATFSGSNMRMVSGHMGIQNFSNNELLILNVAHDGTALSGTWRIIGSRGFEAGTQRIVVAFALRIS